MRAQSNIFNPQGARRVLDLTGQVIRLIYEGDCGEPGMDGHTQYARWVLEWTPN